MKNKYLVLNENKIYDPEKYIRSSQCSKEFRKFVWCEISDEKIKDNKQKSEYLNIASKLGFNWEPNADNAVQYDYKADLIMRILKEYARVLVRKIGFPIYEVRGANIFDMSYPVVEAYAKLYGERLYQFKSGSKKVVMSYDASYPQFNLANKYKIKEDDLPFAHFSISDCYRHEQKGECMLLHRMRRFFMPDLHPYFRNDIEAFEWYPKIEEQIIKASSDVKCQYQIIAEISSLMNWEKYKNELIKIFQKKEILIKIIMDNPNRYWIINVDYKIVDKLNQSREIACIQIDLGNAKRLNIRYIDKDNKFHYPAIIHSAVPGGFERFIYMMFDKFRNRFPIWLHPIQIRLIPIGKNFLKNCLKLINIYGKNIRIDIDDRNESVSKRIKRAKEELIPNVIVIGSEEIKEKFFSLEKAVDLIKKLSRGKPFINYSWPRLVSKQIHRR